VNVPKHARIFATGAAAAITLQASCLDMLLRHSAAQAYTPAPAVASFATKTSTATVVQQVIGHTGGTFMLSLFCCCAGQLPSCRCGRPRWLHLQQSVQLRSLQQNDGDSGYRAYTNARVINPPVAKTPTARTAYTPENAEATATSQFGGIHRMTAPASRRTYATVQVRQQLHYARSAACTLHVFFSCNENASWS
jgi:hypothetical protein